MSIDGSGLNQSVIDAFLPSITKPLEGVCDFLYQDVAGWVTTSYGVKVDPISLALPLPWTIDGRPATQGEITAQWNLVKTNTNPAWMGLGAKNMPGNTMRLSDADTLALGQQRLALMAKEIVQQLPDVVNWPADAQAGLLGVTWATGPHILTTPAFMAPFVNALHQADFTKAAKTAVWQNVTPKRRAALITLFQNAAAVVQSNADYTALNWPNALAQPSAVSGDPMTFLESALGIANERSTGTDYGGKFGNDPNALLEDALGITERMTTGDDYGPEGSFGTGDIVATPALTAAAQAVQAAVSTGAPSKNLVKIFQTAYNRAKPFMTVKVTGLLDAPTQAALVALAPAQGGVPAVPPVASFATLTRAAKALYANAAKTPPLTIAFQNAWNAAGKTPALVVDGVWGPSTATALNGLLQPAVSVSSAPSATAAPVPLGPAPVAYVAPSASSGAGPWILGIVAGAAGVWAWSTYGSSHGTRSKR